MKIEVEIADKKEIHKFKQFLRPESTFKRFFARKQPLIISTQNWRELLYLLKIYYI